MKKVFILVFIGVIMGAFTSCKVKTEDLLPGQGVQANRNAVVFLGDSITEGYGLSKGEAYPSLIQSYWANNNILFCSVNEGISGNTTGDIIDRLDSTLSQDTCFVFLEIGANDAFRGYRIEDIRRNLTQIIKSIREKNIKVALMAMEIPKGIPGISEDYMESFAAVYDNVGKELNIPVMPSLLEETFRNNEFWQSDGIHPTAAGQKVLAKNVLNFLNKDWILE